MTHRRSRFLLIALFGVAAPAHAQFFEVNTADVPGGPIFNQSRTENVDFGDVDLDGDWDAIFADGGDSGDDQNRIWINNGGLQGGTLGTFTDATATRFPVLDDDSRDIEFADIDNDQDLDIYTTNTAQLSNQGNRWWVNLGGEQGGSAGFYADETGTRWVGLNSANSSISDALLLPDEFTPETFIDWSCDCDFGDLDADGDLDLVHSSYGGAFGGGVPTRLFLNDGDGHYEEFNPSGFKLFGSNILPGSPGLWCEGVQTHDTLQSDGTECDIATSALDVDLADIDGDLDLDILHGARNEPTRMFLNRLAETGTLGFRDVTGSVFPAGHAPGVGHYEQEMGDLDGDGDLDLYGLNWDGDNSIFGSLEDYVFENLGGTFGPAITMNGSAPDDNEADFIDIDNDGDLDVWVSGFAGPNRVYGNTNDGGVGFSLLNVSGLVLPDVSNQFTTDSDVADVDGDGDYDVFEANDGPANRYYENVTETPDTTAPSIPTIDIVAGGPAEASTDPVRAQVYDNAPYYITWYNPTAIELSVNGIPVPDAPMVNSGGQVFYGEVPGNLVGDVEYRVTSQDEYGNSGSSALHAYTNTGNAGTLQGGETNGAGGTPPTLQSLTAPLAGQPLYLAAGNVTPGALGFFVVAAAEIPGGTPFGDGVHLNLLPPLTDPIPGTADASGDVTLFASEVPPAFSGVTLYVQAFLLDGQGSNTWSSTRSLALAFP